MRKSKWSPVFEPKMKPIGWWWHKVWCEFFYWIANDKLYYKHLNIMWDKYGFTLYGR